MNLLCKRLAFLLVSVLLMSNIGMGQNNLALQLTESSILLDRLVVCGDTDYQRVIFTVSEDNSATRSNILATLTLFDGVVFDSLDLSSSTNGVSLASNSTSQLPIFQLPDMSADGLSTVEIGFMVKATCEVVNSISANNEIQVFDTWQLEYELNGTPFSENFEGVEYKNTITIPNLSLDKQITTSNISLNEPFQQEVEVINSGLNSYLDQFIYRFTYPKGIVFQTLQLAEEEIPFSKEATLNGDTLVTAIIGNELFPSNTIESGILGNEDNRFDVDEIVLLKETLLITDCETNGVSDLGTTYEVEWGCGAICQRETASATINLGIGEEQIQFAVGTEAFTAGFCSEGITSIVISNNGFEFDDGFGAIFDITAGVGFIDGEQFSLLEGGYEITSLQIGEILILAPDSLIVLNNLDFFLDDPDGAGGLADADGDGYYDDLPVGEQFSIIANYQVNCTNSTDFDLLNSCDNDFRAGFDSRIAYRNACGGRSQQFFDNFFRSFNSGGTQEICSDPDVFNNNDEFTFVYSGERRRSNFAFCNANEEIRAQLILPEGVQVSEKTFLEQDSLIYTPTITTEGEAWLITFDATNFNQNKDYNLNLVFRTECAITGFSSFPVQIEYLCTECDCGQLWYCGVLEGTWIHASGPPCPEETCAVGIAVNSFDVERTTFGYTDPTFTTPIDSNTANKEVALTCDSVRMTVNTTVGQTALSDSVGLIITYGNADESISNAQTFLFTDGEIMVTRTDGSSYNCPITPQQVEVDTTNSTKQIIIDMGGCLEQTLTEGDQLVFIGNYTISADAPAPVNIFKKIPEFRVRAYSILDGIFYDDCETFGSLFRIAKLETRFSGPSNSASPKGCEATSLVYSLDKSINATAMRAFFGEEHRQATRVDQVMLTFDSLLETAFANIALDYRVQGGEWELLPDFLEFTSGTYEFTLPDSVSTITGPNQLFQLRLSLIPECSSSFSSEEGNGAYQIATTVSYNDLHYASIIGDGSCAIQKTALEDRTIFYENPPTFSLQGIVSDVVSTETEVEWMIEHCNTSFNADAGLTWIAFELPSDSLEILNVEVVYQSGESEILLLQEYGTGRNKFFAYAPSLSRNIEGNSNDDICNLYKITARSLVCGMNTIKASTGWSCTEFDQLDWSPDDYTPCQEQSIALTVTSTEPFLSADYLVGTSVINGLLCDTSIIDIIVRNEKNGAVHNVNSRITIPLGTRLVPNSFEFAYPSTSDFIAVDQDPIIKEMNDTIGIAYEYADFSSLSSFLDGNGLPGFNVNAPDSSEFRIKYRLITDCDFNDGSVNRYRFQGFTNCGTASNIALAETPPFIFEANPSTSRKFEIELTDQTRTNNGNSSLIELAITNVGNNSSSTDSINITFPNSISFVPSSTFAISGLDWEIDTPVLIQDDSMLQVRYPLPSGLEPDDEVVLGFEIMESSAPCVKDIAIDIATISTEDFFCDVSNENCFYNYVSTDVTDFVLICNITDDNKDCATGTIRDTLLAPNCLPFVNYCLPNISRQDIDQIPITDNGSTVDLSNTTTCNIQQICIYSYGNIFNIDEAFEVELWEVDGVNFSGRVATISDLVDSMNVWDPTGNWVLNESSLVIEGGHLGGNYTPMEIYVPNLDLRSVLGYDTRTTANGVSIVLSAGEHELLISKEDGCVDTLFLLVLQQDCEAVCTPPIVQSVITENSTCNQSIGSATILMVGSKDDYVYEWTPNNGTSGSANSIRTNLMAGGYQVKISHALEPSCFVEHYLVIENQDGPMASFESIPPTCRESNGTVNFTPDNFIYTWSDGVVGNNRTDLQEGTYFVTFTNLSDPSCFNVSLLAVQSQNDLMANLQVETYPNCNETDGVVEVIITGGSGNYSFDFPSRSNRQDGLAPGIYTVAITDTESGCQLSYPFLLESRTTLDTLQIVDIQDTNCLEENNGRITFSVNYSTDFLFPADTIISNGTTTFSNGALPVGDYFVYVQDVTGCITASAPFRINAPEILSVKVEKPVTCDTTQFIEIEISDSNNIYFYDWADLPGTADPLNRTDLSEGIYELAIADGQGCVTTVAVTLPACCVLPQVENVIVSNAACGKEDGSMEIILVQNTEDYTFSLNSALEGRMETSNIIQNLSPEEYEITISYRGDSLCSETFIALVEEDSLNHIITSQIEPATCNNNDGEVILNVVGTDDNFIYTYEPDEGTVGTTGNIQQNLPIGIYQVSIALEGNPQCVQTTEVAVPPIDENDIEIVVNSTPVSCTGNGQIEIFVEGDIGDYTFSIDPMAGTNENIPFVFEDLPVGVYTLTAALKNSPECTQAFEVEIDEVIDSVGLSATTIPVNCAGNGRIALSVDGNMDAYSFVIEPTLGTIGNSSNIFEDLPAGIYQVTATQLDNSQCTQTIEVEIAEEGLDDLNLAANLTPASCTSNGRIEMTLSGRIENYDYSISPTAGIVGETPNIYEDLPAGMYQITASLQNNSECMQTIEVEVMEENTNNLGLTVTTSAVTCFSEGSIELSVLGEEEDYTFSITPEIITLDTFITVFNNLSAGEYTVTATLKGATNCSESMDVTIPSNLQTELVTDTRITMPSCNKETGSIEILVEEGPQNFTYTFAPDIGVIGTTPNLRDSLPVGDYSVAIVAINNPTCSQTFDFTIDPFDTSANLITNIVTTNADCGVANGMATIQLDGAITDFDFSWQEESGAVGESPNIRTNLAAGRYLVTITDTRDDCTQEIEVEIPKSSSTNVPVLSDAVKNPTCGETNGSVVLNLVDDPSNYTFEWIPNIGIFDSTENIRTNLPGGDYQIIIKDNRDTTCESRLLLNLENMEPTAAGITIPPSCNTSADGAASFSPDAYQYTWEDGFVGSEREDLLAGNYTITISDTTATNICQSIMDIELVATNNLVATFTIDQQPSCSNNDGSATIMVAEGSGEYTYSWASGTAINRNLAAGSQIVTLTDTGTGCTQELLIELENPNQNGNCEGCAIKVGKDTINILAENCLSVVPFCLNYSLEEERNHIVLLDGEPVEISELSDCEKDSILVYSFTNLAGQGNLSPYDILDWQVNDNNFTGTFSTILELTALMNEFDPQADWRIAADGLSIIGTVTEASYRPMQISANNNLFTTTLDFETRGQVGKSLLLPIGIHHIEIRDTQNFCSDSLLVLATCNNSSFEEVELNDEVSDTFCFSTNELLGDSVTLFIECLEDEAVSAQVYENTCVILTGQNSGRDTACIILCDELGICDTNILAINVLVEEFEDSLEIGQTQEVCLTEDILTIGDRFVTIEELRMSDSLSNSIDYEVDNVTGCIRYTGEMLGIDTTSFTFCTEEGTCDTIPFIIQVNNNLADNIQDTLFINEEIEYCFDTSIFPGEIVSFENICAEETENFVEFSLNNASFCVEYKGLEIGQDTACIVLCDNLGNCDTAFFGVTVIAYGELPLAVEDIDTAIINVPKVINILQNDIPFGVFVEDIEIIEAPLYGSAIPTLDGSITYTSEEFCARFDEFTYEICNNIGCDTATVKVWIECVDIVIFTAVSPNRDKVNDFFFISGIEEFPNNRLQVYNRWGERVYDALGYKNDWDGTWNGNLELPDGAYFYCLELNDDSERVFRGYLEIHR